MTIWNTSIWKTSVEPPRSIKPTPNPPRPSKYPQGCGKGEFAGVREDLEQDNSCDNDEKENEIQDCTNNKSIIIRKDGDKWCAHRTDFINSQVSFCGFGDNELTALYMLMLDEAKENDLVFKTRFKMWERYVRHG